MTRMQLRMQSNSTADGELDDRQSNLFGKSVSGCDREPRLSSLPALELETSLVSNDSSDSNEEKLSGAENNCGLRIITPCFGSNLAVDESYEISSTTFRTRGYNLDGSGMARISAGLVSAPLKKINHGSTMPIKAVRLVRFGESLGRGASGVVRRALHLDTWAIFALKAIGVHSRAQRHQLVQELDTHEKLDCKNVVSFHGAFYEQGSTVLVLEYMNRGSLLQAVEHHGPLDEITLKRLAKDVISALAHLHAQRHIHRDVKPANILLNSRGDAKLTDMGISASLGEALRPATTFVGTQCYMSPERIEAQAYGTASDIWSFGLVLMYAALGHFPYDGWQRGFLHLYQSVIREPVPRLRRTRASAGLRNFLDKCLRKNPDERWTAAQLLNHPWVSEATEAKPWPWDEYALSGIHHPIDTSDIKQVASILSHHEFQSDTKYNRNSMYDAKFARLASCLGMTMERARALIELELVSV